MDNFQSILRFLVNQKTTIGYSFMALLTIGGERIFSMVSFQCPCNHDQNFAYGVTFLLGPAAVLLIFGIFSSTRFWKLYTGCCLNPMKLCPRGNCFGCLRVFLSIFTGACVAPIMWLCVALLNGTFYECAVSGLDDSLVVDLFCKNKTLKCREELARVPCDRSKLSSEERMELLLMFRAQSQIDHACLFSISASEEHSVPLLRCAKSPGLCYSVTFSKRNKVLDLKPPRAWKIIHTTEESTRSHPKAQHANKKNCFCEHYAQCFKMFDTCDVMLHIYMRDFHKTFY
uniref:Calcium homeostasis modulator family member 5, tandem duplicate 2 n=1 Tax=Astatotilapia calliptera TaxID=8154 RepID=A0AAX7ULU3_ASTCA